MKRVLIITYYWPPSGGAGVQRWLKFSKYLPEFGWQPIIYTPENPEAPVEDQSLFNDIDPETEVIKKPIWEPYQLYKRFLGSQPGEKVNAGFLSENKKPGLKEKISVWIRGNFFIPDARRYWIRPSVKFLENYLKKNPVDAIISTGPPHSMHLIGLGLRKRTGIPWVADFRDPWTEIDFYDKLNLTHFADKQHHRLEKAVLNGADAIVVAWKSMADLFRKKSEVPSYVIHNGFDDLDFKLKVRPKPGNFNIVHVGAMNSDRNHDSFWQAISEMVNDERSVSQPFVKLIGKVDYNVKESIRKFHLEAYVELIPYMPHSEVIHELISAGVLYLPINETPNAQFIVPGKLFEYLASERPILGIGPANGDSAEIIKNTNAGEMIDFGAPARVLSALIRFKNEFKKGVKPAVKNQEQFSRKNLTKKIVAVLNDFT